MTEADALARRYLELWQDYVTAVLADLREPELLLRWIAACSALAADRAPSDPATVEHVLRPRPPPGAASPTGTSGERGDVVADLARRLADVEDRLAALERRGRAGPRPRNQNRRSRV